MSLAERINKRYLILEILEIIFCKKVYISQKYFVNASQRSQNWLPKTF